MEEEAEEEEDVEKEEVVCGEIRRNSMKQGKRERRVFGIGGKAERRRQRKIRKCRMNGSRIRNG